MIGRMLGAARLNSDTYEEVEGDSSATIQALLVVSHSFHRQRNRRHTEWRCQLSWMDCYSV